MKKSLKSLFGLDVSETVTTEVRKKNPELPEECYPAAGANYIFNKELLKRILLFLNHKPIRQGILILGDTGTGKSSFVVEVCARLGIPLFQAACSGHLRVDHLLGSYTLKDGNTLWNDGALLRAMRVGGVFLADEVTRMDHAEQMNLATILDRGVVTVRMTGEIVKAHPDFRFIGTGNSAGHGDQTGAYRGETVASVAFLNRFQKFKMDYLDACDEVSLLASIAGEIGRSELERMVQLATTVRKNFVGRGGDLRTVISTRDVVVWALETVRYKKTRLSQRPMDAALADTVLNGCTDEEREVISTLWDELIKE